MVWAHALLLFSVEGIAVAILLELDGVAGAAVVGGVGSACPWSRCWTGSARGGRVLCILAACGGVPLWTMPLLLAAKESLQRRACVDEGLALLATRLVWRT